MYVINTKINHTTVTFKFRVLKHAIARAQEIAVRTSAPGVKVRVQDKYVRSYDGIVVGWRGAMRTYLIGAGAGLDSSPV